MERFSESNNTSKEPSLEELNINIGLTGLLRAVTVINFPHSECYVLVHQIMVLKNLIGKRHSDWDSTRCPYKIPAVGLLHADIF